MAKSMAELVKAATKQANPSAPEPTVEIADTTSLQANSSSGVSYK